jgi:hypothetical protein
MFDFLLLVPVLSILAYLPYLIACDIATREVPYNAWLPLIAVNVLPLVYFLIIPDGYPWYSLVISAVMIAVFYVVMLRGLLQGADFIFLAVISLFWVVNPFPWPHGLMQIIFYIDLFIVMILTAFCILVYNIAAGNRWGIIDMMSKYPRGIPFIIPIAAAFVMSVMFG